MGSLDQLGEGEAGSSGTETGPGDEFLTGE